MIASSSRNSISVELHPLPVPACSHSPPETPPLTPDHLPQYPASEPGSSEAVSMRRAPSHWLSCRRYLLPSLSLVGLLIIQSIGVIGLLVSVYLSLVEHASMSQALADVLAYVIIFIVAALFAVFIAIDSLDNKNFIQLIALCIFNISLGVYGGILPGQIDHVIAPLDNTQRVANGIQEMSNNRIVSIQWRLIGVPLIIIICSILLLGLTWHLHKEFGWDSYKRLGGNIQLRKALRIKCVFLMLMKFNLFFIIGFCVQVILFSHGNLERQNIVLAAVASLASCSLNLFGTIGVEYELKWVMLVYYLVWVLAGGFLYYEINLVHPQASSTENRHSFVLFSSLTLGMLLSTGLCSIPCFLNFGKGLKEAGLGPAWLAFLTGKQRRKLRKDSISDGSTTRLMID